MIDELIRSTIMKDNFSAIDIISALKRPATCIVLVIQLFFLGGCSEEEEAMVVPPSFSLTGLTLNSPFSISGKIIVTDRGSITISAVGVFVTDEPNSSDRSMSVLFDGDRVSGTEFGGGINDRKPGSTFLIPFIRDTEENTYEGEEVTISSWEQFTFDDFSPKVGAVNNEIILKGDFIGSSNIEPEVYFDDAKAEIVQKSIFQLTVVVPRGIKQSSTKLRIKIDDFELESESTFELIKGVWTKMPDFPGPSVVSQYFAFTVNNAHYLMPSSQSTEVWQYSAQENKWTYSHDFPGSIVNLSSGFSINGEDQFYINSKNEVWLYSTTTNSWTARDQFPVSDSFSPTSMGFNADGFGYVVKRQSVGIEYVWNLWKLDLSLNTWTQTSTLPTTVNGTTYARVGDSIYVVGGSVGNPMSELWKYVISTQEWFQLPDCPFGVRSEALAFEYKGKIYVGGGRADSEWVDDFYEFNPVNLEWTQIADFPYSGPFTSFYSFGLGDRVLVGRSDIQYLFEME